jgi:Flavin containing amine oxidoreductase
VDAFEQILLRVFVLIVEAIPKQLASRISNENLLLNTRVTGISSGSVHLESGEAIQADQIVVATDGPAADKLAGDLTSKQRPIATKGRGVTCIYFSASNSPLPKPLRVLNGDGKGPINNLCVPSDVCSSYAPSRRALISVTVLGCFQDLGRLHSEVRTQLVDWFGNIAHDWKHLQTYSIPYALPDQMPPALSLPERPMRLASGIYVCGDHRDQASIQGAVLSGRRAADAILEDRR